MKNQDFAQSTAHMVSTFSPGSDEGEMQPELENVSQPVVGIVNGTPQTPVQIVDAPLEPRDTPHTPSKGGAHPPVEKGDSPSTPALFANDAPPPLTLKLLRGLPLFWHDRLVEAGLILSMGLYYLIGNSNFGTGSDFLHLPAYLYSFPFLAIFALLSWYRLSFAVALLPLSLPYYMAHKTVFSYHAHSFDFSLIEISLYTCVLVAIGQLLMQGKRWRYRLTLADLRARLGLFIIPGALFALAALASVAIAADRQTALRALREEVIGPLIYVLLALSCLRTRSDVKRLLGAFLGCALIVALAGLLQHFFFASQLQPPKGDGRAHAMYGSANSIGLFFDYALPMGIALLVFQLGKALKTHSNWWVCLLILAGFVPLVGVLYLSQSLGSALALPVALLFILALSVRDRKKLLIGAIILIVLVAAGGIVLRHQIAHFLSTWHDNNKGISTISKRYYLWMSAWHMIQAHPLFGVGMDNWLCYYSLNNVCTLSSTIHPHYWVTLVPGTNLPTGLRDEPNLSHPHDIFLHVWVSMGIFGLLAFVGLLALFFWLFARIMRTMRRSSSGEIAGLEWLVLGVGGAMLAALCQGLIDSAFLEQDLAFCFWMLVAALLILRAQSGTPWRGRRSDP
ncbi:MAG TPA: O-antigen ligase family protein [Ktedonobacteraceae bacterium]